MSIDIEETLPKEMVIRIVLPRRRRELAVKMWSMWRELVGEAKKYKMPIWVLFYRMVEREYNRYLRVKDIRKWLREEL